MRAKGATELQEMRRPLPRILREYCVAVLILTGVAFAIAYARGIHLLGVARLEFQDFKIYQTRFALYGTPAFYVNHGGAEIPWTLPAAMALLYRFYYSLPFPLAMYLGTLVLIVAAAAVAMFVALRRRGIIPWQAAAFTLVVLVTCYPLWFLLETANLELFVVLLVAGGVVSFLRGNRFWAAAFFGAAAALKLTPILYLALFCTKRDVRKLAAGLGVFAALFLISHWMAGPSFAVAIAGTRTALHDYEAHLILGMRPEGLAYDHSLFSICKQAYLVIRIALHRSGLTLPAMYRVYVPLSALAAAVLYFLRVRKLPVLNQVLAVTIFALLLPGMSWDYRLLHLLAGWAFVVFFVLECKEPYPPFLNHILLLFAILFTCQTYLSYRLPAGDGVSFPVAYGGQVKAAMLVVLLIYVLRHPMGTSGDRAERKNPGSSGVSGNVFG